MKIAIVGTGIAGMSAAWLLNQAHSITVYEKNDRPGGHSNTIDVELSTGSIPIDTGFIVYNEMSSENCGGIGKGLSSDQHIHDEEETLHDHEIHRI